MKGIILAGGKGTRLGDSTRVTNKHLLAVYDKPMIYYPLETLIRVGVEDILIISGGNHIGAFADLLQDGNHLGAELTYRVQREAGGIAQALGIAESFVNNDSMAVILGDNYFSDTLLISNFSEGARIFLSEVTDPKRFGVAQFEQERLVAIQEKPLIPPSNFAVTGFYCYDCQVFDIIKKLKPSARGELEITDVNNAYLSLGKLEYYKIKGAWTDMGTPDSLLKASQIIQKERTNS